MVYDVVIFNCVTEKNSLHVFHKKAASLVTKRKFDASNLPLIWRLGYKTFDKLKVRQSYAIVCKSLAEIDPQQL